MDKEMMSARHEYVILKKYSHMGLTIKQALALLLDIRSTLNDRALEQEIRRCDDRLTDT